MLVKCETCTNHREVFYRVRACSLNRVIELGRWPTEWSERKLRKLIREQLVSNGDVGPRERIRWSIS